MFEKFLIWVAVATENLSIKIRQILRKRKLKNFLNKYNLKDAKPKLKSDNRYNPYEGTNLFLIDELIKSGEIVKDDVIMDIGSGAGLFLLYLASNGFTNLYGIELENYLYKSSLLNVQNFRKKFYKSFDSIHIIKGNATETTINDKITHFYIFNSFFDENTYLKWLSNVEESLKRKSRKIKIILLYPTVASMGAMRKCNWLTEKGRVVCKAQVCCRCVNFLIYENKV